MSSASFPDYYSNRYAMEVASVLILGGPSGFPPALSAAVRRAFPPAVLTFLPGLPAALDRPDCQGLELLLEAPGGEAATGGVPADTLLDQESLPRWGVIRFGRSAEALPLDGWTEETLAAVLGEAARRHALARDNARLRGDLLTIARRVSHDLRTPLGGIIATVDMLAETDPALRDPIKPIFSSIDEITKILTRTSFLLKATAQPLAGKTADMGSCVREALLRLEGPIHQKQAVIHLPDSWPEVVGLSPWLELVWWNLIHNALQHSGTPPVITLGWEKEPHAHRFFIRDSGPGLTSQSSQQVFQPFHLRHDPHAVHGLGLPIVRRLTELHGGSCGYTNDAGKGSTFHFTLPDLSPG